MFVKRIKKSKCRVLWMEVLHLPCVVYWTWHKSSSILSTGINQKLSHIGREKTLEAHPSVFMGCLDAKKMQEATWQRGCLVLIYADSLMRIIKPFYSTTDNSSHESHVITYFCQSTQYSYFKFSTFM